MSGLKANTDVMTKELAEETVELWLDYKKIDNHQREDQEAMVKALNSYVRSGRLVLNDDDYSFKHILKFPLGEKGDSAVTELNYKARLTEREISSKLKQFKSDDGDGRLSAHIQALTSQSMGVILALDKEDIKIARAIAVFFL